MANSCSERRDLSETPEHVSGDLSPPDQFGSWGERLSPGPGF